MGYVLSAANETVSRR